MYIEGWEYSQSLLFCATALTTIGYGDCVPKTTIGRLFFCFYAILGICIIGYFFLSLRAVMINGSSDNLIMKVNLMRMESINNYALEHYHPPPSSSYFKDYQRPPIRRPSFSLYKPFRQPSNSAFSTSTTTTYNQNNNNNGNVFEPLFKDKKRQVFVNIITHSGVTKMSIIFAINWFGGAALFCLLEKDWSYLDALYFTFVTQSTIGFGDLVPQTTLAQEFWFIYIIISIAVAAYFVSLFGNILAEKLLITDDNDTIHENDTEESLNNHNDDPDNNNNYNIHHYFTVSDWLTFHRQQQQHQFKQSNMDLEYKNSMTTPASVKSPNYMKLSNELFIKEQPSTHTSSTSSSSSSSTSKHHNYNNNSNNNNDKDHHQQTENMPLLPIEHEKEQQSSHKIITTTPAIIHHQPLRARSKTLPVTITSTKPNRILRNNYGTLHISTSPKHKKKLRRLLPSKILPAAIIFQQHQNNEQKK
ncbi:unnamed protein product [Cunninghamella echinulata]